jgi:16S rRNA (adenine1518-N6/adenine1519-N6)-dimethyltransferase
VSRLLDRARGLGFDLDADRWDQHLLVDDGAVERVVDGAGVRSDDVVLDLGAGAGALTEALAARARHVHAIEIDRRFQPVLDALSSRLGNVTPRYGDMLTLDWPAADRVVANPPFGAVERLIPRLVAARVPAVTLVIGEAVCAAAVATADSPAFTVHSLQIQAHFRPEVVGLIDRDAFYPHARGRAGILRLAPEDSGWLTRALADAFARRAGTRVRELLWYLASSSAGSRAPAPEVRRELVRRARASDALRPLMGTRLQQLQSEAVRMLVAELTGIQAEVGAPGGAGGSADG